MIGSVLAIVLAFTPQTALSSSSDARTEADFRCYAATLVLAGMNADDPEVTNAAAMIAFYYLGRLEGRVPDVDWVSRGIKAGDAQSDLLLAELPRCAGEFEAKSQELINKSQASVS